MEVRGDVLSQLTHHRSQERTEEGRRYVRASRIIPEVVQVFRAQESVDGDKEGDVEGGSVHVSSSPIHSRNNYI